MKKMKMYLLFSLSQMSCTLMMLHEKQIVYICFRFSFYEMSLPQTSVIFSKRFILFGRVNLSLVFVEGNTSEWNPHENNEFPTINFFLLWLDSNLNVIERKQLNLHIIVFVPDQTNQFFKKKHRSQHLL